MNREYFWALLTLVIAVLLAILLLSVAKEDIARSETPDLPPSVYDEALEKLDREAIQEAYKAQIAHLFSTWMKDKQHQPFRALTGHRQARQAYIDSMSGIDARKR
jgi:hypothetical protein